MELIKNRIGICKSKKTNSLSRNLYHTFIMHGLTLFDDIMYDVEKNTIKTSKLIPTKI